VQAYNWIKEGKKAEAEALLIRILGNDERNADAWWLLANALTDPAEQAEALDQLLELRPNDEKAQKMLSRLRLTPPPAPTPPARPIQASPAARPASPPPPAPPAPTREPHPFETVEDDSDPFADVKSSDDDPFAEVIDSRRKSSAEPDPFDDEDPFAVAEEAKPKRKTAPPAQTSRWDEKPKKAPKNNNLLIILGVIAAIVVIVGAICVYAVIQFQRGMQQVVSEVINDPTVQAALNDPTLQAAFQAGALNEGLDGFASARLPSGTTSRGPLMPNQTGRAAVDTFVDDSWIFNADAGAAYTVEIIATDSALDPQLAVYGADNQLIGANDDIDFMENRNSRVQFTASQNGIYTIIVSAFGQGGGYEVIVRR
jgi:hypothetical protein